MNLKRGRKGSLDRNGGYLSEPEPWFDYIERLVCYALPLLIVAGIAWMMW